MAWQNPQMKKRLATMIRANSKVCRLFDPAPFVVRAVSRGAQAGESDLLALVLAFVSLSIM
jgi:hypothetical protein